ncbi:hypothetical protein HETIRDRAFT_451347 [Heterobasidion irregulare TC 32-1]|uniref:Uncharacterized protein n=1 Tax=Heterobasidion irregulare (strain TC 32-1) TaxID=747525 RepID=W4K767_HETIT|nr:uncharacterized protein HETIRDRAFT_451347 [Heterobasidion irregulare TC 32-1]ETW81599.1 hypothetical protein HETIRDRAFT_451347 [Heterobasidion irregulare TC 32-1]
MRAELSPRLPHFQIPPFAVILQTPHPSALLPPRLPPSPPPIPILLLLPASSDKSPRLQINPSPAPPLHRGSPCVPPSPAQTKNRLQNQINAPRYNYMRMARGALRGTPSLDPPTRPRVVLKPHPAT